MNSQLQKNEGWLYGLAFLIAISLRLVQLGALPLANSEAASALQALHIAQGLKPALGPQPAYILLTAPLFFIYGDGTNFLARLVPALAGSFLVFAPLLFRPRFRSAAPVIFAFFLALDPGLVALSRSASGAILAVTFLLFAWGFWSDNKLTLAGFFLGLTLLSGPTIWMGLLGLAIAWALQNFIEPKKQLAEELSLEPTPDAPPDPAQSAAEGTPHSLLSTLHSPRIMLISTLTTFILVGTLFFIAPNGLSAALASIPAYTRGWAQPSGISTARLLASLIVYEPLAVLLGLICIIRAWWHGRRRAMRLSIWMLTALLLAIFYPARQVTDLIWAIIPMLALASIELARHFMIFPEERAEVRGVVALTVFIFVFAWLDLTSISWTPFASAPANMRIYLFFGALILLFLSILLVAAGWSVRTAKLSGLWGLTISLAVITLASTFGAAGLRGAYAPEFWPAETRPAQADLLLATVNDLSDWSAGNKSILPVIISGVRSPALEWLLREHQVTVV
ncbi:MAG: hypothetical protein MUO77_11910, partial [Anaerolineales bacterium]|nr:hypothetical protein [Anaerolineales bacterium]